MKRRFRKCLKSIEIFEYIKYTVCDESIIIVDNYIRNHHRVDFNVENFSFRNLVALAITSSFF